MKRIQKLLAAAAVLLLLAGCGAPRAAGEITALSPDGETVALHTFSQSAFLDGPVERIGLYARGKREKSRPKPVEFRWDGADGEATVRISEQADMADAQVFTAEGGSLDVYNLKIGTTYYWTVSAGGETSRVYTFSTEDEAPRNLYIDGVTNARDLGGRQTADGRRVRQGMLYRCGRLNVSDVDYVEIEITPAGAETMLETLGVRTEIDVRMGENHENGTLTASPLGDTVQYIHCPMAWDGEMLADNREQIARVFSVLAKEENYPVFLHCNIGTDRTGMLSFFVNALLGVPQEALYRDYLFSNFGDIGGKRPLENLTESDYYAAIQASPGETLAEKTYNCLVANGVAAEDLDALRRILLEPTA